MHGRLNSHLILKLGLNQRCQENPFLVVCGFLRGEWLVFQVVNERREVYGAMFLIMEAKLENEIIYRRGRRLRGGE
jgi:hypothetical protein